MINRYFFTCFVALTMLVCCNCTEDNTVCPRCGRTECVCDEYDHKDDEGEDPGEDPDKPTDAKFVYLHKGRLTEPDGDELKLWGVNFQTPISWEYNGRLNRVGVAKTADGLNAVTDVNLEQMQLMGVNYLRCHLTPADFTDAKGNLIASPFLDALDYLINEAAERDIYVSFAFLNHMGQWGEGSAWIGGDRSQWIQDAKVVGCAKNYIRQLINHVNKYSKKAYKDTENIVYWEIINEPSMYSYDAIKGTSSEAGYNSWLTESGNGDSRESYALYRTATVKNYINDIHKLLRDEGDQHQVCWSLNWHRYRNSNEDIFEGVAQSDAEVVAFCNYPGQDLVAQNYWDYSYDFTETNFASWFSEQYQNENGYGWALTDAFADKAKVVYEFETFFNQSAYLYPVQSTYFRSLGVQTAAMWTYTFQEIAPYFGGSHFLNLTCTPSKAAAFIVAQEIFRSTALGTAFPSAPNEQISASYAISKQHDAAIYSSADKFFYSSTVDDKWNPLPPSPEVDHIVGIGSSPIVEYSGSGIYFIDDYDGKLHITMMPDVEIVGDQFKGGDYKTVKTRLDSSTKNRIAIKLSDWAQRSSILYRVDGDDKVSMGAVNGTADLRLVPGSYIVEPK